jgi:hypothetical protein
MKADIFKPQMLPVFYLIFLALAALSFVFKIPLSQPSWVSFAVTIASFPFFVAGVKLGKKAYGKTVPFSVQIIFIAFLILFYFLVFNSVLNFGLPISLLIIAPAIIVPYLLYIKFFDLDESVYTPLAIFATGSILIMITFLFAGGIPLLNTSLKTALTTSPFWGAGMLLFFLGFSFLLTFIKDNRLFWLLFVLSSSLFLLTAFRYALLIVFLTGTLSAYYSKRLKNAHVYFFLVTAFMAIVSVGYYVSPLLSPFRLLLYRAGSTFLVFDSILAKAMPLGFTHGSLFLAGDPRAYVAGFLGANTNLTYTLLGSATLDFGILGAFVWMLFLGFVLSLAYRFMRERKVYKGFYPLLFSISLVTIEVGFDQFLLTFFWAFLFLYMVKFRKEPKK